ncbi:MAG: transcriptional repressor [Saprospiraceae bacterium]|nr:transcriptional repressor [Saprospiraceae bacterium]
MKLAKKKQWVLSALASIPDVIWIEDLYLSLIRNGQRVNIRTVYDAVRDFEAQGMVHCDIDNRRTMVRFIQ